MGAPTGSFSYLIFVTILGALDLDVNIVDITGQTEGAIELVAERLDVTCGSAATYGDYLPSGQLIPILTFGDARKEAYPDCPTAKELGYDELAAYMEFGFFFPQGTDEAIIDKFNEACRVATQAESYKETCDMFAVDPVFYPKEEAQQQ